MHLQTADNNINPLKVPTLFANVFAGQETFSTIDHEYDPIQPICMTDRAALVTVHNFNELAGFAKLGTYKLTYTSTNIEATYKYRTETIIPRNMWRELGYTSDLNVFTKKSAGDGLVYNSSTGVISLDPDSAGNEKVIDVVVTTESTLTGYTKLATVAYNFDHDIVIHIPVVQMLMVLLLQPLTSLKTTVIQSIIMALVHIPMPTMI